MRGGGEEARQLGEAKLRAEQTFITSWYIVHNSTHTLIHHSTSQETRWRKLADLSQSLLGDFLIFLLPKPAEIPHTVHTITNPAA